VIVLVDTDVLIDVALDRGEHAEPAGGLLDALEQRPGTGFLAWHTVSNFYYLVSPARGRTGTREFILDLLGFVEVAPTTTKDLRFAAQLQMQDFEDAMQVAAAVACRADVIATRNTRDYPRNPIPAETPKAVLQRLL
jgi:predicted nucleic acid-binding protein